MKTLPFYGLILVGLAATACNAEAPAPTVETEAETAPPAVEQSAVEAATSETVDPFAAILAGAWRAEGVQARDAARNPAETLTFFEISPDDTVIEIWPGRGWYTDILAPYLATGDGTLVAALWDLDVFEGD